LFRKGDPGCKYYILLKGKVCVFIHNNPQTIKEISKSDKKKIKKILHENCQDDKNKQKFTFERCMTSKIIEPNFERSNSILDESSFSPLKNPSSNNIVIEWDTRTQLKMNRPFIKIAYFIAKFWNNS